LITIKKPFKRVFLIVLDSVGIGEMPDAHDFDDVGANTLGNIIKHKGSLNIPHLRKLGLANIDGVDYLSPTKTPLGYFGKMAELSSGKDTMTGHWELMGLKVKEPFQTFTEIGFPTKLIHNFEQLTGRNVIGNKAASGTEIIDELGEEHVKTGNVIVYTSSDSVFQIAAHEEVIPLDELYRICEIARELTFEEPYKIGRVIARPFIGEVGSFKRTANRRDYAIKPFAPTVLNALKDENYEVIGIGKISDIYNGEGISKSIKTLSNADGVNKLLKVMEQEFNGLAFINLVDFDMLYGHRRDPDGYGRALEAFDVSLKEIVNKLGNEDMLIITADHGNDPTYKGTDHTREYVPLLVYSPVFESNGNLGIRKTFADIGATLAANFNVKKPLYGESFLKVTQRN